MKANEVLMLALKSYKEVCKTLESLIDTGLIRNGETVEILVSTTQDLIKSKYNLQRLIMHCIAKTELDDRSEFINFKVYLAISHRTITRYAEIDLLMDMVVTMLDKIDLRSIKSEEL